MVKMRNSLLVVLFFALLNNNVIFADDFLPEGIPPVVTELQQKNSNVVELPRFDVLAEALSPSVVNISVEAEEEESKEGDKNDSAKKHKKKFKFDAIRSLGSGIIISSDGYIVTNNHVIEESAKVVVRLLNDKTDYPAEIVGIDKKTDLAIIKINAGKPLQPAYIGDSDELKIGEWVLAIGNQFHLGQTVTAGIISAKSRKVPSSGGGPYDDYIQTDASINPGSSGGPLFNSKGQVVGINTAIFSPGKMQFGGTGFNIGIGFSIPINRVKNVITQLKESGKVTRGVLGVIIQNVTPDIAEALSVKPAGALVAEVLPNMPGDLAGMQVKDIVLTYDGHPINEHDDLPLLVANTPIATTVNVEVWRDGKIITLSPKIDEMNDSSFKDKTENKEEIIPNKLGINVQDLTQDVAKVFNLSTVGKVIVVSVEKDSPAEQIGISRGDIIDEVAGTSIKNKEVFDRVVKTLDESKPILILLRKGEHTRFITVDLK